MTTIVIAAHNEAAVIGRCLDALLSNGSDVDIVVVANGCSDNTASVAASRGVRVVEVAKPGKAAALNTGESAVGGFPRIYLDADIVVPSRGVADLVAVFDRPNPPLAAVPSRRLDVAGRPLAVRAYFAINARLPIYQHGLFGRGMIAVSAPGRARFATFPELVADDLFLDSLFSDEEKVTVPGVIVVVATPLRTAQLIRRLVRVRRGNAAMRRAGALGEVAASVRPARRLAWLTEVVAPRPWLLPAGLVYAAITSYAALGARLGGDQGGWGQDRSTRIAVDD